MYGRIPLRYLVLCSFKNYCTVYALVVLVSDCYFCPLFLRLLTIYFTAVVVVFMILVTRLFCTSGFFVRST